MLSWGGICVANEGIAVVERNVAWKERAKEAEERWIAEQAKILADMEREMAAVSEDPYLTPTEAATIRKVHPNAIYSAIKRGTLVAIPLHPPGTPPQRRNYRIRRSVLDLWMEHAPHRPKLADCRYAVERHRADGYLTIGEAAKALGVCRSRVNALCKRANNPLPRVQLDDVWFISRRDVEDLRNQRMLRGLRSLEI
jgi:hypothetical protein